MLTLLQWNLNTGLLWSTSPHRDGTKNRSTDEHSEEALYRLNPVSLPLTRKEIDSNPVACLWLDC